MTSGGNYSESVQNYLAGRMSEADRSGFESQLLQDEGLVRDLEESLRLREGLEILRERQDPVLQSPARRHMWPAGALRACAAALLLMALYVGVRYAQRTPTIVAASIAALPANPSSPLTVIAHYTFATLRGSTQAPALPLPIRGAIELRALTRVAGATQAYRVTLEEDHDHQVSRIGAVQHLVPDADGFVHIYADASKLQPGNYLLSVEPDANDTASGERFEFSLTRTSAVTPSAH
jgi:hypothetical protein